MTNKAMNHPSTMTYNKITDNIYVGTAMCCNEHERFHAQKLAELGIDLDIDLRLENNEVHPSTMAHLKLPIPDTYPPNNTQLKIGVDAIDDIVKAGKKVYVHCQIGHGRSPTLVMAYLILKQGMAVQEAIEFVKKRRPEAHPTDRQIEFLHRLGD